MGCRASKSASAAAAASPGRESSKSIDHTTSNDESHNDSKAQRAKKKKKSSSVDSSSASRVYKLLVKAAAQQQQQDPDNSSSNNNNNTNDLPIRIVASCTPKQAAYQNPKTGGTPLHIACSLLDAPGATGVATVVEGLLNAANANANNPNDAASVPDAAGNIPLHYAIAPTSSTTSASLHRYNNNHSPSSESSYSSSLSSERWQDRAAVVNLLLTANPKVSQEYLQRNNVHYSDNNNNNSSNSGGCSPLYRAIQTLPDDFDLRGPTVKYITILRNFSSNSDNAAASSEAAAGVGGVVVVGNNNNASDGDTPLALLYRRFTRQFDLAEKFFSGDNSRPEVVQHRTRYKTAAGNTWKLIELLLRPDDPHQKWRIVHRAVQVETPPDLLRYIVETNAEDLTVPDEAGNLPLHYAAKSKPPPKESKTTAFPAFYTKYVVDELLYKFPEAASTPDAEGNYPLTLAVRSGKQWIGGGIKSLYDAFPDALKQINLEEHVSLRRALSLESGGVVVDGGSSGGVELLPQEENGDIGKEEKNEQDGGGVIRDEHHDAIMLVQQPDVDVAEVVTSMWAHEEDAGVQMLGCVAISRMANAVKKEKEMILRIALSAVAAVVNAMKAHPNEVIVQEKACLALKGMAKIDGMREVSFVASGAIAAIVGAMQAHVSDPGVQEEACAAVSAIIHHGGADRATIVASVSGLTAIINAIAAHPDVVGVQRHGCMSLRELTEYPSANLPEVPRSQTEPLLLAAKEQFPKECTESVDILLSRLA